MLSASKEAELRKCLEQKEHYQTSRAVVVFSSFGAVLIGLGLLLFIGSNWDVMSPFLRIACLVTAYAACAAGAQIVEGKEWKGTAEALWLLTVLALGANIFLIGQIFNLTLTYWEGTLLWAIGAFTMGVARRQPAYGYIVAPLLLLTLGWVGGGGGWFFDDELEFLVSDNGLRPLLPFIGICFVAAALLFRRSAETKVFAHAFSLLGVLMFAVPLVVATVDSSLLKEFFFMTGTAKQIVIMSLGSLLVIMALAFGESPSVNALRAGLGAGLVVSLALLLHSGDTLVIGEIVDQSVPAFALYILCVFSLSLVMAWVGIRTRSGQLINVSVLSTSFIVLIQYFSWSFEMLDSSVAFLLGGLILIGVSIVMERARRSLHALAHA